MLSVYSIDMKLIILLLYHEKAIVKTLHMITRDCTISEQSCCKLRTIFPAMGLAVLGEPRSDFLYLCLAVLPATSGTACHKLHPYSPWKV